MKSFIKEIAATLGGRNYFACFGSCSSNVMMLHYIFNYQVLAKIKPSSNRALEFLGDATIVR